MSDKEKEERRVVGRAGNNALASGGLVYASARSAFLRSRTRATALGSPSNLRNWPNMRQAVRRNLRRLLFHS